MPDIMLIVHQEIDKSTRMPVQRVSHGICLATDRPVVLPHVHPQNLGAVMDESLGEWVLRATPTETIRGEA